MKKNSIFILVLTALVLSSCDLTLYPEHETTPDQYFRNESDLLLWSNNFYNDNLSSADIGQNDADDKIDNGLSAYITGSRNAATQSWGFTSLRNINYMLDRLDQCEDAQVRKKYEAVGRFFRAWFYFLRVRTYGDVPWFDHVYGSADRDSIYKDRDDRGYVMDRILEDIRFAADNLPSTWETNNTRVTKWAALALGTRAALYEGTFRKYHSDLGLTGWEKYLEVCAEMGKEFIDNAPFSLYNEGSQPYRDLFWGPEPKTEEVILCRAYSLDLSVSHSVPYNIQFGRTSFTKNFMNHYLMADGTRFQDRTGWATMTYPEEVANRDPRMAQTVLCPGFTYAGSTKVIPCKLYSHTGYEPIKYIGDEESVQVGKGRHPWIIFRAAEVYLNYAEAVAELGTITQNDLDMTVNKIKARAKMPSIKLETVNASPDPYLLSYYKNVTKSAQTGVILEIRRERTVELVIEDNTRAWDLFRWKEARLALNHFEPWYGAYIPGPGTFDMDGDGAPDLEVYSSSAVSNCATKLKIGDDFVLSEGDHGYIVGYPGTDRGGDWDDAIDYLWPVPKAQIDLYADQGYTLSQNPGWDKR
ncbi:MAG: RagB/SusD family nutrient uptake outer membrane protein [Bacteroidales bacterium]|nr:RagB/SusD family nutrient uptake outer membrane protein [Bacteroidales bacterium]